MLPGVAISYMMGMNFFIGAATFGIAAALGIGFVNQKSRIKNDTAIGIVFSAFFALGIILISFAKVVRICIIFYLEMCLRCGVRICG